MSHNTCSNQGVIGSYTVYVGKRFICEQIDSLSQAKNLNFSSNYVGYWVSTRMMNDYMVQCLTKDILKVS